MSSKLHGNTVYKILLTILCVFLAILSVMPFLIMLVNATRSTTQIQQKAVSLIPSKYLISNFQKLTGKSFKPSVGFLNSFIISVCATSLSLYFSTLTAFSLVIYDWKLKNAFFKFILAIMMIPGQITMIGFYQMVYKIHMTNKLLMLILPAIAAPQMVFFMRQYMIPLLSPSLVESARIDGAKEFRTYNQIVLPIMKPALATQAIFAFVANWNNLFTPLVLLTKQSKYTLPIMVSLLKGDIYRTEHGAIYLGLSLTALPLIVIYLILSKYIVSGVALGSVKG